MFYNDDKFPFYTIFFISSIHINLKPNFFYKKELTTTYRIVTSSVSIFLFSFKMNYSLVAKCRGILFNK